MFYVQQINWISWYTWWTGVQLKTRLKNDMQFKPCFLWKLPSLEVSPGFGNGGSHLALHSSNSIRPEHEVMSFFDESGYDHYPRGDMAPVFNWQLPSLLNKFHLNFMFWQAQDLNYFVSPSAWVPSCKTDAWLIDLILTQEMKILWLSLCVL